MTDDKFICSGERRTRFSLELSKYIYGSGQNSGSRISEGGLMHLFHLYPLTIRLIVSTIARCMTFIRNIRLIEADACTWHWPKSPLIVHSGSVGRLYEGAVYISTHVRFVRRN